MANILLRSWNWCRRFRHRCGYGVHSPSDFFLVTSVVYECWPFYAYKPLHHLRRVVAFLPHYREKVDRFLFRLVNHLQPSLLVEIGTGSGISTRYMSEACASMQVYTSADKREDAVDRILSSRANIVYLTGGTIGTLEQLKKQGLHPDLVHIGNTPHYREAVEALLPLAVAGTCFIIGNPYADAEKKSWWKELVADERTGVTFDLYDVGLVFFDKQRAKEHHIINFL